MLVTTTYELYTSPMIRVFARLFRHFKVFLSNGKKVRIDKSRNGGICRYRGDLTQTEEVELMHAMMLMGL